MTSYQAGYWTGVILGGIAAGFLCGLIPAAVATRNGRLPLGIAALAVSVMCGLVLGMLLAAPVALVFLIVILVIGKPAAGSAQSQTEGAADGMDRMAIPTLVPDPRGYTGTAITIAAMTALPFALLWSWLFGAMQQRPFGVMLPQGILTGALFGLSVGLTLAFFFRVETAKLRVEDREQFVSRVNVATAQIGYYPESQASNFLTFKPSFQAGWAAGKISVQIYGDHAVIVGPKTYVSKLVRRLIAG